MDTDRDFVALNPYRPYERFRSKMDIDTLYWFLSTVAQTLAAMVAVTIVVVVYRLEQLSRSISRQLDLNADKFAEVKGLGAYREEHVVLNKLSKHYDQNKDKDRNGNDTLALIGKVVLAKNVAESLYAKVRENVRAAILFSVSTIGISVFFLLFVRGEVPLSKVGWLIVSHLAAAIVMTGFTLSLVRLTKLFFALFGKSLMCYYKSYKNKEYS